MKTRKLVKFDCLLFEIDSDGDIEVTYLDAWNGDSTAFLNKGEQKKLLELLKESLGES